MAVPRRLRFALVVLTALGCRVGEQHDSRAPASDESPRDFRVIDFGTAAIAERGDGLFAYTEPGELPQLTIVGEAGEGQRLPVQQTEVDARIRGPLAQVRVRQRFQNPYHDALDASYRFALPENAAVDEFRVVIGERVIAAEIRARDEAVDALESADASVFIHAIPELPAGASVELELRYRQVLTRDAGLHEFVFPLVVGPRRSGCADCVHTRLTPAVLGEGTRSGHDLSLSLEVEAGAPISSWDAPTQAVVGEPTARGFRVRLADAPTLPNRDFVIRWDTSVPTPRASLLLGSANASGRGHFGLVVTAPPLELDALVGRREFIFVVERSPATAGAPRALAKQTLGEALARLRPVDSFDVVGFDATSERLFGTPRPANAHNRRLAERFIDGLEPGAVTLDEPITAALAAKLDAGERRVVLVLTRGLIASPEPLVREAAALVGRAAALDGRAWVFAVGLGPAPRRELIAELAAAGDAAPLYVDDREDPREVIAQVFERVDRPVLDRLEFDWGGLEVEQVYGADAPVFASQPLLVTGRYRGELERAPRLRARLVDADAAIEIAVAVVPAQGEDRLLASAWAEAKLAEIDAMFVDGLLDARQHHNSAAQIGAQYRLVSAATSLVAVDTHAAAVELLAAPGPAPLPEPELASEPRWIEWKYTVTGEGIAGHPAFGGIRPDLPVTVESFGGHWPARAWLTVGPLRASAGVDARAFERALERSAAMFEACYEQRVGEFGKVAARLRLRFADGRLVAIEPLAGGLGNASADACVAAVLRRIELAGLPAREASVEVELRLRMRR